MNPRLKTSKILKLATSLLIAQFAVPALAQGQQGPASQGPAPTSEKLDVSDLERKYWSAKDTDFNVVQNRLYSKAGRYALSAYTGKFVNDPWSDGWTLGGALNYYFSERYGMEASYTQSSSEDNQAVVELSKQGGKPNHGKYKKFYGVAFNWVPFYAKMSVLNSSIAYFDMSISPGIGISEYDQQMEEGTVAKTAPTLTLDVTQHFFLNKHLSLRIDLKNKWYQEEKVWYRSSSVPAGSSRSLGTEMNHTSFWLFGVTMYY